MRLSITLNTGLVYDESLQKAGVYINSAAKKLGQPSAEIHADPTSAAKQKEASHGGTVGFPFNSILTLQPLAAQGCSEASWFSFDSLLKFSALDDCTLSEQHLNRSLIQ